MRFSRQLYKAGLDAPSGFRHQRTSALLSRGLLAHTGYPGIPTYTPIGTEVLARIEGRLATALEQAGFSQVRIPSVMKDSELTAGEPVGEQFLSKILFLSDTLRGYHLLTSPEMLLTGALGSAPLSHRDLPIRVGYLTDIFRQMKNTRSILRLRQFRVLGGLALEPDDAGVRGSLDELVALTVDTLAGLGLPLRQQWSTDPLHVEIFYPCAEGSTNVADEGSLTGIAKALSLAVGYHYAAATPPPVSYRTAGNALTGARMATYALCTNRVLYAVFDRHRDSLGFSLPASLRPFDAVVVPVGADAVAAAERLHATLVGRGIRSALDDRLNRPAVARQRFADYLGAPVTLRVGADDFTLIRRGGRCLDDPVRDADELAGAVQRLLGGAPVGVGGRG
ncbi:hypothetical protein [Krasilnikovia sp. MM14-A1259]|uniref:hypothetical protein n=1 Tax=Krasilnikovia sp. MM14-A1259 TaxID=3373539 RepID=UPI00381FBC4D